MHNSTELTLGFSPCPNDCFMFDAMIHHKIDTEGLEFIVYLKDVETLNQKAFDKKFDVTKLSFHAFSYITHKYQLLTSGSALGKGCGPLFVTNDANYYRVIDNLKTKTSSLTLATPGEFTTATFLFALAFPFAINSVPMKFNEIEDAVLSGEVDAGLLIHENRFTYESKGLKKIIDLGAFWETMMLAPIPLGGIAIKKELPEDLKQKMNRVMRKSVEYAFENPQSSREFVKLHSQELSDEVLFKHIDLYVNNYSVNLDIEGKRAVNLFMNKAKELGVIESIEENIFVE